MSSECLLDRSCWRVATHDERRKIGIFKIIKSAALNDREIFYDMLRMQVEEFEYIGDLIRHLCVNQDKRDYRRTITFEERLAVAIRFIVIGES